jgi:hypothetical protein
MAEGIKKLIGSSNHRINTVWSRSTYRHNDISVYIVLRLDFQWTNPMAQPVPNTNETRIMPVFLVLSIAGSNYEESYGVQRMS